MLFRQIWFAHKGNQMSSSVATARRPYASAFWKKNPTTRARLALYSQVILGCLSFINMYAPFWVIVFTPHEVKPVFEWTSTVSLLLLIWLAVEVSIKRNRSWRDYVMLLFSFGFFFVTQKSMSELLAAYCSF